MRRRNFPGGRGWGSLPLSPSVGWASHNAAASRAPLAASGSTSAARLEGVWEGEICPVGPDMCMPHSLKVRDEQLWPTFETSFKGRTVAAMIGLYRVGRRGAEAAEAADER